MSKLPNSKRNLKKRKKETKKNCPVADYIRANHFFSQWLAAGQTAASLPACTTPLELMSHFIHTHTHTKAVGWINIVTLQVCAAIERTQLCIQRSLPSRWCNNQCLVNRRWCKFIFSATGDLLTWELPRHLHIHEWLNRSTAIYIYKKKQSRPCRMPAKNLPSRLSRDERILSVLK